MKLRAARLSPLKALGALVAGIWGFGVLVGVYWANRASEQPAVTSALSEPLVKQIQQLGDLHTVRYNVHDVLRHERTIEPKGWVRYVPGSAGLYGFATRNSVLVTADGGIEAGVDLSQVTEASVSSIVTPDGLRIRVRLPYAKLYTPDVHLRVVDQKAGLFWRDANIVPEAGEEAANRFRDAAIKSNILAVAEANAVTRLNRLQAISGRGNVEFVF